MKSFFKKVVSYILILEAKLVLRKYKPKIITITGSVGKTSTKDTVYAVLSGFAYVRKSEKSYNSQIGLPLTILGLPNGWNNPWVWLSNIFKGLWLWIVPHKYPEWLVLEVGVGKPGDMRETAEWLKSDVVMVTAIGETPVHIEFFDSRKHLIEEKSGLIKTLKKEGVLILNADDEAVLGMKSKTKSRVYTYGLVNENAIFKASEENILYTDDGVPEGISYKVEEGGKSLPVFMKGAFGANHIYSALATLACASALKWDMLESINRVREFETAPGRMKLLKGIKESLLIDDTYNSSPFACEGALETLGKIKTKKRKIVVFGDMLELGKHTKEAHREIGRLTKGKADVLVVVGQRSEFIKAGALESGMNEKKIYEFVDSRETGTFLKDFIKKGDVVLIKGSQGMRMERAVEMIMQDQADKENLLVRQEPEWLERE